MCCTMFLLVCLISGGIVRMESLCDVPVILGEDEVMVCVTVLTECRIHPDQSLVSLAF